MALHSPPPWDPLYSRQHLRVVERASTSPYIATVSPPHHYASNLSTLNADFMESGVAGVVYMPLVLFALDVLLALSPLLRLTVLCFRFNPTYKTPVAVSRAIGPAPSDISDARLPFVHFRNTGEQAPVEGVTVALTSRPIQSLRVTANGPR